jgi:methionine-rich copper-binding protein CopC
MPIEHLPHLRLSRPARDRGIFLRRMGTAVLLSLALPTLTATPANAHSALKSSDPANGSTLTAAPNQVNLVFNEEVEPRYVDGALTIGSADPVPVSATVDAATVVLTVPAHTNANAETGGVTSWRVDYRVVSADGHPISGAVTFSVSSVPGAPVGGTTAAATAPVPGTTQETPPNPQSPTSTDTSSLAPSTPTTVPDATVSTTTGSAEGSSTGSGGLPALTLPTVLAGIAGIVAGIIVVIVRRRRGRS